MSFIVTRGLGSYHGHQGFITGGFGPKFVEEAKRLLRVGQSGTKRALREMQETVVWVKLIRINDSPVVKTIQGAVKVRLDPAARVAVARAERLSARVKSVFERIKITVKRV